MPVEIRELIIKTEVSTAQQEKKAVIKDSDIQLMRKQLLEECKRLIATQNGNKTYKR